MEFSSILEAGRQDFLEAVCNIAPDQAAAKSSPNSWSVLECIEHVAIFEDRYLGWISDATAVSPQPNADKEMRLFTMIRSRLTKVEAPDALRPQGKFATVTEALANFEAVRDRSVQLVKELGAELYSLGRKHPYFGNVNGAELIYLIDGHTRRHADQIREIGEASRRAPQARSKPGLVRKSGDFKRDIPDIPDELESTGEYGHLLQDGESATLHGKRLHNLERTNLRMNTLRVEDSALDCVRLSGGQFGSIVWKDVRLVDCDLANIRTQHMTLLRVELVDCRLTGLSAAALEWQDVLILRGNLGYAHLQGGSFRSCEFDECNWQDADLQNADLTGSIFRSCKLTRADLHGARLQNTDFRGSEVAHMQIGVKDFRGAIFDAAQAMVLARWLGLDIR